MVLWRKGVRTQGNGWPGAQEWKDGVTGALYPLANFELATRTMSQVRIMHWPGFMHLITCPSNLCSKCEFLTIDRQWDVFTTGEQHLSVDTDKLTMGFAHAHVCSLRSLTV